MEQLTAAAAAVGVMLDQDDLALFRRYGELLEQGADRANLTGARGWERIRDELIVRSLRVMAPAPGGYFPAAAWFDGRRVLDLGTGAGIPGLVLKLAAPGMRLSLLDASAKKCAFLRHVIAELGLLDTEVLEGRAEELARNSAQRETYDVVVSRGVARLSELAELALPFTALGGTVIALKGGGVEAEVAEAEWAAGQLGAAPAITQEVASPGAASPDTLVYWMKIRPTPDRFPRRNGVPHSRPLLRPAAPASA